jgi:peroxin-5
LCQAENEQDNRAIAAFRRSLNIDPLNLDAILGLAVSYANESMENDALLQLQRWLDANAEYSNPQASAPRPPTSSFLDQARFAQV